ncbi:gluconate 2-dehydrogenase subunit 3 family protein [Mycolicibacterium austroafricanum]|uniref:Gluconate 2-dehydrogenase subunit 3 family protein n=1 Tax=Mycolicibacterium austroafricanum TaxID=39687 RepID=A0ABT8HB34_MYCAO|nr:gluconate 2-dehydrogenase subunit 3 family protein [Mycolicibacterium austroafricanum]MDN4517745.1 hypothetical protein [Mycolicibacterium austroafricanum]PQP45702.1 hypothetical protein C6A88_19555 [Mycolicibacterium austroafricanum]QRZ08866.1 hypothetical protein JN090_10415 [Mycolicibacterium austroafricanum]QZT70641.1 gluconate 2-dehydrogenase subunit 3 family protein [Mycolicibacterium austroafricanum]
MTLTPTQRAVFSALSDLLIPASETMPSATEAGVADTLIDQALSYRPDLSEDFVAAVRACEGMKPEAALDDLAARDPARFTALTVLTAGAYTASARVLTALNYRSPPVPVGDDTDTYVDLLADVVARGFRIR